MSIDKIITVTIFLGFVLFGDVPTTAAFTIDEYSGQWNHIAMTSHMFGFDLLHCYKINIIKTANNSFSSVYNFILNGSPFEQRRSGWVDNNEITELMSTRKPRSEVSVVHSYNNGQELILEPKDASNSYRLISRSTYASPETKVAFKKFANAVRVSIAWTDNSDCAYA